MTAAGADIPDKAVPGIIFDITRLTARAARPAPSGIDRVERAWLAHLCATRPGTRFLLTQDGESWILPFAAGQMLAEWIACRDPAVLPLTARLALWGGRGRWALRRAVMRSAQPLPARFPAGGWYLNFGQENLPGALPGRLKAAGLRRALMLHDTIPLDHPEFCAPHAPGVMAALIRIAAQECELLICNSAATRADFYRHAAGYAPACDTAVAWPGAEPLSPGTPVAGPPWFLALGTIEPRKNHALLLDVRDHLAAAGRAPDLVFAGRWGWQADALRARIHACGPNVKVLSGAGDSEVADLLRGAAALLMPSFAEGFGMPVAEAMRMGTPVIAAPLAVYREFAGNYPQYIDPGDTVAWAEAIAAIQAMPGPRPAPRMIPGWDSHFARVFSAMAKAAYNG